MNIFWDKSSSHQFRGIFNIAREWIQSQNLIIQHFVRSLETFTQKNIQSDEQV